MKIAIMTQPLGHNYGGIMQAWALQQVIKNAGHEPVTIDRRAGTKGPAYNIARLGYYAIQKALGKRKLPINFDRYQPYIQQRTHSFIDQYISISEKIDSTAKLKAHFEREQYDAVIVGSDQTWRPRYSPNIDDFFLGFLQGSKIRRIAYASSFGVDDWEFTKDQTQRCALLAKKFDAISVRESSGVDLCEKYFGVDAAHVLDPTLLVERSVYEALCKTEDIPLRQGIYTYILDQSEWKTQLVETAKQILKKPQYCNQPEPDLSKFSRASMSDFVIPSLEGWVKGFADADFVITDSFHGTVFSILYNKPFITIGNKTRGMSRFLSLLRIFGLENRLMLGEVQDLDLGLLNKPIDWKQVNAILEFEKTKALRFIEKNLEA